MATGSGTGTPVTSVGVLHTLITQSEFSLYTQTSFSVSSTKLAVATAKVQAYCGTDFGVQTLTREKKRSRLTSDQDLWVDFYIKPVVSVSRIALAWGADTDDETELSTDNMDLFTVEGYALVPFANVTACVSRIARANVGVGWLTLGDEYITVSNYVGGASVPEDVKQAIALLAWEDHLVMDKIADTGDPSAGVIKSFNIGAYSETKGASYEGATKLSGTLGWGTALAQKAEGLLIPYAQGGCVGVV